MSARTAALCLLSCWLLAASLSAFAQDFIPPRLSTIPSPAPVDAPFFAIVSLPANPSSIGFSWGLDPTIEGNTITAQFDAGCGFICPGGVVPYANFALYLPALPAGQYTLNVVTGNPSSLITSLPLTIASGRAAALTISRFPAPANQPFDGVFSILAHPDDLGVETSHPQIDGNKLTFSYDDYAYCVSTCSNDSQYRSFPIHFPALAPGRYDVEFVAYYIPGGFLNWPQIPPVAKFSISVAAATSPVPLFGKPELIAAIVSLMTLTSLVLWRRKSRLRT